MSRAVWDGLDLELCKRRTNILMSISWKSLRRDHAEGSNRSETQTVNESWNANASNCDTSVKETYRASSYHFAKFCNAES